MTKYKFGTRAIHAGVQPDPSTGAIMTPVFQTSTYVQEAVGKHKGYTYSRTKNPTRNALEHSIAALENGEFGACFASGLAAIDALFRLLKPGDEVISTADIYGGSYRIFKTVFEPMGIRFHFTAMDDPNAVAALLNKNTKMVWVETPTNPMLNLVDIEAVCQAVKSYRTDIWVGVDNTFATPYLQNPLDLGADVVMHSATKYFGGHSDVVMGALVTSDALLAQEIYRIQNGCGAICGPQDAFLVLRGIKTLHLRMRQHCENGKQIANYLNQHPKVARVNWPGLPTHPNHEIAKKQMHDFGGMLSFSLKSDTIADAHALLAACEIFALAESLGGVESLAGHPASMTHGAIPKAEREKLGIVDSLIRLSIGVEDPEDLIADLEQALSKI